MGLTPIFFRILLAWGLAPIFLASAQTAVLLEAGDAGLRADLRWLADRGVLALSSSAWPLPLNAVQEALASRKTRGLTGADEDALARVERLVRRQSGLAYGVAAQTNTGSFPQTDFQRQARAEGALSAYAQHASGAFAVRLQANALSEPLTPTQDSANLEGSYLAASVFGQILYAGQLAHFWGPGNNASLIWSNAATAIPGLGLKRATERPFETKWLSWMGSWSYELFVGEMLNYRAVPHTRIAAARLGFRPLEGLELGASYLQQWGGEGLDSSLDGLFGYPKSEGLAQPNNALAGFDLRYTWRRFANPVTLYAQGIAEDEMGNRPAKWFWMGGVEFKHAVGETRFQWYAEAADTMSGRAFGLWDGEPGVTYTNSVYTGGLYHYGLPVAHAIGGDGEIYSAGVQIIPAQSRYGLRYGARAFSAEVNPNNQPINQAFPRSAKLFGGELSLSANLRWLCVRAALGLLRDRARGDDDISALVTLELPLDR